MYRTTYHLFDDEADDICELGADIVNIYQTA